MSTQQQQREKRTVRVNLRVTPSEMAAIRKVAEARWPVRYMSMSDIVRSLVLSAVPITVFGLSAKQREKQ